MASIEIILRDDQGNIINEEKSKSIYLIITRKFTVRKKFLIELEEK